MIVTKEDLGNDMRRVPAHDLVEEVGRIGHRVVAVPATGDMADEPDSFTIVLSILQLFDHPGEDTRVVGLGGVDQV